MVPSADQSTGSLPIGRVLASSQAAPFSDKSAWCPPIYTFPFPLCFAGVVRGQQRRRVQWQRLNGLELSLDEGILYTECPIPVPPNLPCALHSFSSNVPHTVPYALDHAGEGEAWGGSGRVLVVRCAQSFH